MRIKTVLKILKTFVTIKNREEAALPVKRLNSEEEAFFFERSRSQESKMAEGDTKGKKEKVISKMAPKTAQ